MRLPRLDKRVLGILGVVAMLAVVAGMLFTWRADPAAAQIPARLEIIAGDVTAQVSGSGEWVAATEGMPLPEGTRLRTDSSGRAQITYFEGSVARLDSNTEIQITRTAQLQDSGGGGLIGIMQSVGSTWHRVMKLVSQDSRYEVQTPTAVAAVRGTTYRVDVARDGTTSYFVFEGSISVRMPDGRTVVVGAGQKLVVPPGATVGNSDVKPITPADKDAWFIYNTGLDQAGILKRPESRETSPVPVVVPPAPPASVPDAPARRGQQKVDRPPVFVPTPAHAVRECDVLSFVLTARDPEGTALVFSATGLPRGAAFVPASRRFTWRPGLDQAGRYTVVFSVTDGVNVVARRVTITVRDFPAAAGRSAVACVVTVPGLTIAASAPRTVTSGTRFLVAASVTGPAGPGGGASATLLVPDGLSIVGSSTVDATPASASDGKAWAVWLVSADSPGDYVVMPLTSDGSELSAGTTVAGSRVVRVEPLRTPAWWQPFFDLIPGDRR